MSGTSMTPDGQSFETGAYDPTTHENQIVAIYQEISQAQAAENALVAAGISKSAIQVVDERAQGTVSGTNQDGTFWGAMKNLFAPEDETHAYSHAVGNGHALVIVTPDSAIERERVIHVLESTDPIDFDAKLAEWRESGYDYSQPHGTGLGTMAGAAAAGTAATSAGAADARTSPATARTVPGAVRAGDMDTIKVMEERLRVGKREVAQGAVRVRSYIVERPVEEQVRLREERVSIERRPVDRAASPDELDAFQERTIEASGFIEEAVVSKEARVVEEVGVSKQAAERVETVRDTVRKTEVKVEDGTKTGAMGTGGTVTNATPGATSSGMNSPRK